MDWIRRLLKGDEPVPPVSPKPAASWDELVEQARSRDGRRRQAAVRALASSGHGAALPVLLERLNDWVPVIRRDALVGVQDFLRPEFIGAWISALAQVDALVRGGRADHTETLVRIGAYMLVPDHLAGLGASGRTVPREVARLLLRLQLQQADSPERSRALREALLSHDIVLASMAALVGLDGTRVGPVEATALCRVALQSRFAGLRIAGLRVALAHGGQLAQEAARALCFDGNANARALAIETVRSDAVAMHALVEAAIQMLSAPRSARSRAVALEALCMMDGALGAMHCRATQHDPAARVRLVARRRLHALATPSERDAQLLDMLADPSSRVRRLAEAEVRRGANPPSIDALRAMCLAQPASLGSVLSVSTHLAPWNRFAFLLELLPTQVDSPRAAGLVQHGVVRWNADMYGCFVAPSPVQREEARRAWARARDLLSTSLQCAVALHLKAFGVLEG